VLTAWRAASVAWLPAVRADDYSSDPTARSLTNYLHTQKLPLVHAQITPAGSRRTVGCDGFTATELGKQHAEEKAKAYLNDSRAQFVNRVRVNPELANLKSPSTGTSAPTAEEEAPATTPPDTASNSVDPNGDPLMQQRQAQQQSSSTQQQSSSTLQQMLPLILMGAMMFGFGGSHGGMMVSPGYGSSYGYGPGYGSGYGSGYGPSPYSSGYDPYYGQPYDPNAPNANTYP